MTSEENELREPPLGIMPAHIWKRHRIAELNLAIIRYLDAGLGVPPEWLIEYVELVKGFNRRPLSAVDLGGIVLNIGGSNENS
jgi:hypothetical protein